MKHLIKLVSILCLISLLAGCGSAAPSGTDTPHTTSPIPTETEKTYPEPGKLIALTFDDGPNEHMGTIVEVLAQYDAKATFFVIGEKISPSSSQYISQAYSAGHEIGNHSYSHTDLTVLSAEEVASDVEQTQVLVEEITGQRPVWFRAPFLKANDTMYQQIAMPFAGCGVSAGDGSNDNLAEDRHYKVVNGAYDGAIALLHCNGITAQVLPQILEDLKMQGYEFVTVSALFDQAGISPEDMGDTQLKDTALSQ